MKTPADFATSPAIIALNTITAVALIAGAVNAMAVNAEATDATSPSSATITDDSGSIINYDTAAQQSYSSQFGKPTYVTTNTNSYGSGLGSGFGVDDAKTVQD
jgi:hypothetical protein